jgi:predicted nucleic acid-binding protein
MRYSRNREESRHVVGTRFDTGVTPPPIVLDTGVVISALIGSEDAESYRVLRGVATGDLHLALSDDFLNELSRVVGLEVERPKRRQRSSRLAAGLNLAMVT